METDEGQLDKAAIVELLRRRGVLPDGPAVRATALEGGVSNEVLAIEGNGIDLVVKQALPRLRVSDVWEAKLERVVTEGRALRVAAEIVPGAVPPVVDIDFDRSVLTIERAPRHWANWKSQLLAGHVDPFVAARLGEVLAAVHQATAADPALLASFDDVEAFEQLRVDPYHRTVAQRVPVVADAVLAVTDAMLATKRCLVHGDYSPKNVLVGDGVWVLDWEVAHAGDPAFDVAFLLNHLVLKAVHMPAHAGALRECADQFVAAYDAAAGMESMAGGEAHVVSHLACLLLARALGKSPAEYLTADERETVAGIGTFALRERLFRMDDVWKQLT